MNNPWYLMPPSTTLSPEPIRAPGTYKDSLLDQTLPGSLTFFQTHPCSCLWNPALASPLLSHLKQNYPPSISARVPHPPLEVSWSLVVQSPWLVFSKELLGWFQPGPLSNFPPTDPSPSYKFPWAHAVLGWSPVVSPTIKSHCGGPPPYLANKA